jgi:uncharacterized coiled-coil protein SlyX
LKIDHSFVAFIYTVLKIRLQDFSRIVEDLVVLLLPYLIDSDDVLLEIIIMTVSWDRLKDFLTLLVFPLILWGIRLEVNNAIQEERIANLQSSLDEKIKNVENKVSTTEQSIQRVESAVQSNSIQLARLDGKLESLDEKLDVIRDLLENKK